MRRERGRGYWSAYTLKVTEPSLRTCCGKNPNDRWVILALADLCLRVVIGQTVVVRGRDGRSLPNATEDLREADNVLPLLIVGIDEDRMLWTVLRMVLEELGKGKVGVQFGALERRAVGALPCLHRGIVEAGSVLQRHSQAVNYTL